MGWLGLLLGLGGAVAVLLPSPGMFVAMGLGIAGVGVGWVGWRRRGDPGPWRLAGAAGTLIAAIVLALALTRYVLTLLAIDEIERLLGG
jgi:hypothetical protein